MRIIANVFGARHVPPRVEALAGKVMAAAAAPALAQEEIEG